MPILCPDLFLAEDTCAWDRGKCCIIQGGMTLPWRRPERIDWVELSAFSNGRLNNVDDIKTPETIYLSREVRIGT